MLLDIQAWRANCQRFSRRYIQEGACQGRYASPRHYAEIAVLFDSRSVKGFDFVNVVKDDLLLALEGVGEELGDKPRTESLWGRERGRGREGERERGE